MRLDLLHDDDPLYLCLCLAGPRRAEGDWLWTWTLQLVYSSFIQLGTDSYYFISLSIAIDERGRGGDSDGDSDSDSDSNSCWYLPVKGKALWAFPLHLCWGGKGPSKLRLEDLLLALDFERCMNYCRCAGVLYKTALYSWTLVLWIFATDWEALWWSRKVLERML